MSGAGQTAAGPYVEVRDLCFAYAGGAPVLRGLSLALARGRFVGLLGPNGSGKTTLLRILLGLLEPASGEVRIAGLRLADYPAGALARRVAYVPQATSSVLAFTVLETVLMGRSPHTGALGFEGAADWHAARQALRLTDTERFAERNLEDLSGGERQMLAVGRALMARPRLLMLDEPSLGLAPLVVREIFHIIAELRRMEVAVLLVEQNAKAALRIADYGYVLETGTIVLEGPAQDLANNPRVMESYLGLGGFTS